jgi:hypothetical protein
MQHENPSATKAGQPCCVVCGYREASRLRVLLNGDVPYCELHYPLKSDESVGIDKRAWPKDVVEKLTEVLLSFA